MGLCASKDFRTKDHATFFYDESGEMVIKRNLVGVRPGEDIQPRLERLDRKTVKKLMRGKLPYQAEPEHRNFQQSFQPSSSSASASSAVPDEVTFLRTDSEGCLIQTTVVNPSAEDVDFARRQKAELLQQLGPAGVANLRPLGFERSVKQHFTIELS